MILAALIALGIVLSFINIPIPSVGISLSFGWLPTILAGWFFGPIYGIFIGISIDTLNFLIHGGIWYWLYAIQEPLVGLITGLLSSMSYFIKNRTNSIRISFITFQIFFVLFYLFTNLAIIIIANTNFNLFLILANKGNIGDLQISTLLIVIFVFLGLFFILIEIIACIKYKKMKFYKHTKNNENVDFYYICIVSIVTTFLFSFLLGPVSTIEYYKYINNKLPNSYINYGLFYYLIPRIIKEMFKTPLYIFLLWGLVVSLNVSINRTKNKVLTSWEYS